VVKCPLFLLWPRGGGPQGGSQMLPVSNMSCFYLMCLDGIIDSGEVPTVPAVAARGRPTRGKPDAPSK
jgi:hypothetical protein